MLEFAFGEGHVAKSPKRKLLKRPRTQQRVDCIYADATLSDHPFFRTDAVKTPESELWLAEDSASVKHTQIAFVIDCCLNNWTGSVL